MALVAVNGGMVLPNFFPGVSGQPPLMVGNGLVLDAADEKAAIILRAPKAGTISAVHFTTRTVTTGATLDVRLETVDGTTGDPSGTLLAANTNGACIVANGDDFVQKSATMTAGAVVTQGQELAVVFVNPSVSPGNLGIANLTRDSSLAYPYSDLYTGAWVKSQLRLCIGLEYNDGSFGCVSGAYPFSATTAVAFNSGSTPDERGMKFSLPFGCRVSGVFGAFGVGGDAVVKLYDSDGTTQLATTGTLDKENTAGTGGIGNFVPFTSSATLAADTDYRLTLLPSSTTNVTLVEFDVGSAAQMDAHEGGQDFHHTSRADAGAWTDTTTKRPFLGIVIDAVDTGAGGGALLRAVGMTGGLV